MTVKYAADVQEYLNRLFVNQERLNGPIIYYYIQHFSGAITRFYPGEDDFGKPGMIKVTMVGDKADGSPRFLTEEQFRTIYL